MCPSLCLYAAWQPSRQLRSQWAQSITMATSIVGKAVAAPGSVLRLFFGILLMPELIIEFLLLNVLPKLARDLMCTVFFPPRTLLKNRRIFRVIKMQLRN